MSSLKNIVAQRSEPGAATRTEPPTCYRFTGRGDAPFVEFHVTAHARHGFPVGQLCHYTLESNAVDGDEPPERLTLGFPTADVVLFGARLATIVEKLQTQSLTAVLPLDARYAGTLGANPWVARIVVSRIDKQGDTTP